MSNKAASLVKVRPPAKTIALINMKGGVGKTTLAVNLAWHLCRRGQHTVLLVDLDPQFNASQYLMDFNKYNDHKTRFGTVADILIDSGKPAMSIGRKKPSSKGVNHFVYRIEARTLGGRLDVLPSELALCKAIKNPHGVAYKLEKALETLRQAYDYIFIDCAPTDSVLTDTALMASDFVLIPVKPDRFSVLGYAQMQETIEDFRSTFPDPHKVKDLGVVFTRVTGKSDIEDECMAEVRAQATYVFKAKVRDSKSYLRSVHEQSPVFDTRYTHYLTKSDITALVNEMGARIGTM